MADKNLAKTNIIGTIEFLEIDSSGCCVGLCLICGIQFQSFPKFKAILIKAIFVVMYLSKTTFSLSQQTAYLPHRVRHTPVLMGRSNTNLTAP